MATRIQGITIEFNSDSKKVEKSLNNIKSEAQTTQKELKSVNYALKLDPKNTEMLAQKQELLAKTVENTKSKLETLKEAQQSVNDKLAGLDSGSEEFQKVQKQADALAREIVIVSDNLETAEENMRSFGSVGAQQIAAVGSKMQEVGGKMTDVGKKMTTTVTAPIIGAGTVSAKLAMDFEDSMAKVSTIADETEVPLKDLQKQIMELSNKTGISANDIAENVYNAISAGQKTGDAVEFVGTAAELSAAGFADSASALDILTTIMNAYGKSADETGSVCDMLIQTQNLGKTTVAELSSNMGKVIPTAKGANVELDQLCAAYAVMTSNGIATAESTTYLNGMISELGKSGTKVSDKLQAYTGKSFKELMGEGNSLTDVLGMVNQALLEGGEIDEKTEKKIASLTKQNVTYGNKVTDLQNKITVLKQKQTEYTDKTKESTKVQDQLNIDKYSEQIEQYTQMIEDNSGKITELGESTGGAEKSLTDLFGSAEAGRAAFVLLNSSNMDFNDTAGKMVDSTGSMDSAFGKLDTDSRKIKIAFNEFKNTSIELGTAIMDALAPVLDSISDKIKAFSEWFSGLSDGQKQTILIIAGIVAAIGPVLVIIGTLISSVGKIMMVVPTLVKAFNAVKLAMMGVNLSFLACPITWIILAVVALVAIFVILWVKCEGFRNFWKNLWENIKSACSAAWEGIKSIGEKIGEFFTVTIPEKFKAMIEFLKSLPQKALQWGKDFIQGLIDGIKEKISGVVDSVKGVAEKIKSFLHFSRPDEGPLKEYESWMPDFMQGLANGITSNAGIVKNALGGLSANMTLNPVGADAGSGISMVDVSGTVRVEGVSNNGDFRKIADFTIDQINKQLRRDGRF